MRKVITSIWVVTVVALLGSWTVLADELHGFDIKAADASMAVREFGKQSGVHILVDGEVLKGRRLNAVKGAYSTESALKMLLAGSGLTHRYVGEYGVVLVPKTDTLVVEPRADLSGIGALRMAAVGDEQSGAGANSMRKVDPSSSQGEDTGENQEKSDADNGTADTAEEIVVTGTHIRGLLGEQSIQPILTITSKEIERTGVNSLGELFRYIPQVSSFAVGQATTDGLTSLSITPNSARVTASIRGGPAGGTLLLINGRRAPKNGQESGDDAYDLGGIPLAAVERVDVLLDGASAVYGADAVAGVVNVILKKNYRGTEVRLGYENTFETDVGVRSASLMHGFSRGNLSGTLVGSLEEANSMMWQDRQFLKTLDRREFGGSDSRRNPPGGSGMIRSTSGNLPGLSTNTVAIPVGSTGIGLTVQDYANAGDIPEVFDLAEYYEYSSAYRRKSAMGSLAYSSAPHLNAFAEFRWSKNSTWSIQPPVQANGTTLPAGSPGNPFGVPVRLYKYYFDLPRGVTKATSVNRSNLAGVHGRVKGNWRYEATINQTVSRPELVATLGTRLDSTKVSEAFSNLSSPILAYDSKVGNAPNSSEIIEALTNIAEPVGEHIETWAYGAQMDGTIWTLSAGALKLAVGTEYREENMEFPPQRQTPLSTAVREKHRYTSSYYAEFRAPIISNDNNFPLLDSLEITAAIRSDQYSDFPASTTPRYGALYRPVSWIMFRGSYGKGYKVPTLSQLYAPERNGFSFFSGAVDPLRGNESISSLISNISSGNSDLSPERSKNTTAGIVVEVPLIEGLSFSCDYWDTRYIDRVGSLPITDRILLFPETIIRGANLETDQAGWAGPIESYIDSPVNIGVERISGYDFGARFSRTTNWGELDFKASGSRTTRREVRASPSLPPTIVSTRYSLPLQINSALFLNRGFFQTGILFSHRARYQGYIGEPFTSSATRWDWQGSFDMTSHVWKSHHGGSWWAALLKDTRVSMTIFNVLNTIPPLAAGTTLPDNTILDSRLRRYSIKITKAF